MEKTVTIQLNLPQEVVALLDNLAKIELSTERQMTLLEWNSTASGRQFWQELTTDPKYRALSTRELNALQVQRYRQDVPRRHGPLNKRNARISVICRAIQQLSRSQLKQMA